MAINTTPIYSRIGDVQGGVTLVTQMATANAYSGQDVNCFKVFDADNTNGGYLQRLRFKAIGTNVTTVARIFVCEGDSANGTYGHLPSTVAAVSGTPTGTASTSGTLKSGNYYAKIQAVDQYDSGAAMSTESAAVTVTGPTGNITWNWTASTGAEYYRIFVGNIPNGEFYWFYSTTNSYNQTEAHVLGQHGLPSAYLTNLSLIGELSLPATTASATAGTTDIDFIINMPLPPGYAIFAGLATTVANGWMVTAVGGKY